MVDFNWKMGGLRILLSSRQTTLVSISGQIWTVFSPHRTEASCAKADQVPKQTREIWIQRQASAQHYCEGHYECWVNSTTYSPNSWRFQTKQSTTFYATHCQSLTWHGERTNATLRLWRDRCLSEQGHTSSRYRQTHRHRSTEAKDKKLKYTRDAIVHFPHNSVQTLNFFFFLGFTNKRVTMKKKLSVHQHSTWCDVIKQ